MDVYNTNGQIQFSVELNGQGNFSYIPPKTSGLHLDGEIRDFKQVKTSAGNILVVARSNDSLQVFKVLGR